MTADTGGLLDRFYGASMFVLGRVSRHLLDNYLWRLPIARDKRSALRRDVSDLYRVLLGRKPTREEFWLATGADQVSQSIGDLVLNISQSVEFKSRFQIGQDLADERDRLRYVDYKALVGAEGPVGSDIAAIPLRSTVCQQVHFTLDQFRFWIRAVKEKPNLHRKQWEYFYIAQSLFERGLLQADKAGLVFGVGREPLPALFASFGVSILATDQSLEGAIRAGWIKTNEHSVDLAELNTRGICTTRMFEEKVSFAAVDMNDIDPAHDGVFDFCWSTCALEHLGSLRHGMDFVKNSLRVLKPGGVAVHTTEFNLSSNSETIESTDLALYRQRDIAQLIAELEADGHHVEPIDWTPGAGMAEQVADLPPYSDGLPHIRLRVFDYDCTSIGLIITKAG